MTDFCIDKLFPSNVIYKDYQIENKDSVVDKAMKIINQLGEKPFYSPCISTVHTSKDLLNLDEFESIKKQIIETVAVFCDVHKIVTKDLHIKDAWLNYYDINGYQDLHHHPDSMISGVYYLDGTETKDFVFQAPWYFHQPCFPEYSEVNIENCYNVEYESVTGRCIVFMSHLMHRTLPAVKPRISLSFNIRY